MGCQSRARAEARKLQSKILSPCPMAPSLSLPSNHLLSEDTTPDVFSSLTPIPGHQSLDTNLQSLGEFSPPHMYNVNHLPSESVISPYDEVMGAYMANDEARGVFGSSSCHTAQKVTSSEHESNTPQSFSPTRRTLGTTTVVNCKLVKEHHHDGDNGVGIHLLVEEDDGQTGQTVKVNVKGGPTSNILHTLAHNARHMPPTLCSFAHDALAKDALVYSPLHDAHMAHIPLTFAWEREGSMGSRKLYKQRVTFSKGALFIITPIQAHASNAHIQAREWRQREMEMVAWGLANCFKQRKRTTQVLF